MVSAFYARQHSISAMNRLANMVCNARKPHLEDAVQYQLDGIVVSRLDALCGISFY